MKLGVITKDFRVYNRLLALLKGMNEHFVSLRPEDNFIGFDMVFTDMDLKGRNVFKTDGTEELKLKQLIRSRDSKHIIVGIDPGPAPGIATLADNVVIDKRSIYDFSEIRDYIFRVKNECRYSSFVIKVGNGDRRNRNQIIKSLGDFRLQIVDEKGSSREVKRGEDSGSAINIALSNDIL
ncbi:MAG: hypothetical protein QXU18_02135 [Thermoplasmatales archaeon]